MSVPAVSIASTSSSCGELRRRLEILRAEVAQAEAKIPRTVEAIRTRKETIARLEARLALEESHPARTGDE